jgi:hypothetical protein
MCRRSDLELILAVLNGPFRPSGLIAVGKFTQGTTAQALTYCVNSCSHLSGEINEATVERSSRERRRW